MLKRILAATMLIACASTAALADDIDPAFGNTVRVTLASGAVVQYHYNPDHTYQMIAPDGARVSGSWVTRDGQLCATPQGGAETCVPAQSGHGVGDTWTQTEPDGSTVTVSIVAGR